MWNRLPPLSSLRLFDCVVRHRSMTRAAAEAGVSQSAVSQSIRQLEDFVQAPLLDRSRRPMVLTPSGEAFHLICMDALGRIAHQVEQMRQAARPDSNALIVSCNLGFATYWLMPRLNYFSAENPDVSVHVMAAYQGAAGLREGSDVAIRYGDGSWPDGPWQLLFHESLIPACTTAYLDRSGAPQDPAALAQHRLIEVSTTDADWLGWEQYFKRLAPDLPSPRISLRFGNYVQAVQAALAGDGIMLGWRSVVGDLIATGQMQPALNAPVPLCHGYHYTTSRTPSAAVRRFLGWMQAQADTGPGLGC